MLKRLDLAVGILARQQVIQAYTRCIQVALRARYFAGKQLGRHITGCAGIALQLGVRHTCRQRHAHVEQFEFAAFFLHQIRGFHIAVDDRHTVQHAQRLGHLHADGSNLGQAKVLAAIQMLLQSRARVKGHHIVQMMTRGRGHRHHLRKVLGHQTLG